MKVELWIFKQANDFTAQFPRPGKPLDYSKASLAHLDELTRELSVKIPSGARRLVAVYGAGAYFGEVLHRNMPGRWVLATHVGMPYTSTFETESGRSTAPFQAAEREFAGEGPGFSKLRSEVEGESAPSSTPMKPVAYSISVRRFGEKKDAVVDLILGIFHLPPEMRPKVLDGSIMSQLNFPARSHAEAFARRLEAMGAQIRVVGIRESAPKAKHPLSPGQAERIAAEALARHRKPGSPADGRILLMVWNIVPKDNLFFIEEAGYGVHPELYFSSKPDAAEFLSDMCLNFMRPA